jgi:phytoene dehydrogenase-like protein
VVGLLDDLVVRELGLADHGYRVFPADPNLWCPFPDGTSFGQFLDDERTAAHMRENGFSDADVKGALAYEETFDRIRHLLRQGPAGDTWLGSSPSRAEVEEILGDDELVSIVFEESIADTLDRYVSDERLRGWAGSRSRSPRSPGRPGRPWPPVSRWPGSCRGRGWSWRAASWSGHAP